MYFVVHGIMGCVHKNSADADFFLLFIDCQSFLLLFCYIGTYCKRCWTKVPTSVNWCCKKELKTYRLWRACQVHKFLFEFHQIVIYILLISVPIPSSFSMLAPSLSFLF